MNTIDFLLIIPEIFQVILINILLLFSICFSYVRRKTFAFEGDKIINNLRFYKNLIIKPTTAYTITPVALMEPLIQLTILCLVCSSVLYMTSPLTYGIGLTDSIVWDNLSRFMSVLICVSACTSLMLGSASIKRFGRYEFIFIIWLSIIGMLSLIKSYNFLALYLSIELQSLSFYMLAAMRSKTEASAEAGLKYFILSAFSSAILLLGITFIYAASGSQNFADLHIIMNVLVPQTQNESSNFFLSWQHFTAQPSLSEFSGLYAALSVGLGCVCISLLFKLAAAPFHAWVADVYEGSPTPITALFAITAKIGAATALIRILELHVTIFEALPLLAILSVFIGTLSAMRQVKLKRLLAFSGVANVGWFLFALITGQWDLLIIHLIVYILLNISLFSVFILPLFRIHPSLEYRQRMTSFGTIPRASSGSNEKMGGSLPSSVDYGADSSCIKYISDLNQIYKTNPSLALIITIAMFSLAGIPPLAGFYSKYLIINALTQRAQYLALVVALASAILSAFYYVRVIKTLYFVESLQQPFRVSSLVKSTKESKKKESAFSAYGGEKLKPKKQRSNLSSSSFINDTNGAKRFGLQKRQSRFFHIGHNFLDILNIRPFSSWKSLKMKAETDYSKNNIYKTKSVNLCQLVGTGTDVTNNSLSLVPDKIKMYNDNLKKKEQISWFTIHCISINAYICALSTILTLLFFIRPDYISVWL